MNFSAKITTVVFFTFIAMIFCGLISDAGSQGQKQNNELAKIVSVTVSGNENAYTFNVGVSSPDAGCKQYANWWEIVSENGELMYRRILAHSHVNEQPFVRSGGSVNITNNQTVIVRVHMNTSGYSIKTLKGSVNNGFTAFDTEQNFATDLATQNPLPNGCAF